MITVNSLASVRNAQRLNATVMRRHLHCFQVTKQKLLYFTKRDNAKNRWRTELNEGSHIRGVKIWGALFISHIYLLPKCNQSNIAFVRKPKMLVERSKIIQSVQVDKT